VLVDELLRSALKSTTLSHYRFLSWIFDALGLEEDRWKADAMLEALHDPKHIVRSWA